MFCMWCIPGKFYFYIFPSYSLSFSFFLLPPANFNTLISYLLLSFYFSFFSFFPPNLYFFTDGTAKYVLQKLLLICHHCVLFLSFCRLLLLQVMPLSHLHPSHFLLVQTCLGLYLSALLPYPQVRILETPAWLQFGDEFSVWLALQYSGHNFRTVAVGKDFECCRARQNKSLTSREDIIFHLPTFFKRKAPEVTGSSIWITYLLGSSTREKNI